MENLPIEIGSPPQKAAAAKQFDIKPNPIRKRVRRILS
jgi:hypothetical protein